MGTGSVGVMLAPGAASRRSSALRATREGFSTPGSAAGKRGETMGETVGVGVEWGHAEDGGANLIQDRPTEELGLLRSEAARSDRPGAKHFIVAGGEKGLAVGGELEHVGSAGRGAGFQYQAGRGPV